MKTYSKKELERRTLMLSNVLKGESENIPPDFMHAPLVSGVWVTVFALRELTFDEFKNVVDDDFDRYYDYCKDQNNPLVLPFGDDRYGDDLIGMIISPKRMMITQKVTLSHLLN